MLRRAAIFLISSSFAVGLSAQILQSTQRRSGVNLAGNAFVNLPSPDDAQLADNVLKTMQEGEMSGEIVVHVGEDGMRRSAEKTFMPVYPKEPLKKDEREGVAVIEAQYNGKGVVTHAVIIQAPAPPLGQAVVAAIRKWKFKPSMLDGKPISVRGKLTFYFIVDKDKQGRVENPEQFQ
jgi:TonB family protein